MKKVVVIGGGTGTYTVLRGLKAHNLSLSVIVTMADSGGSNRVLRDEFGLLPTSDIRQCIVALADEEANETLRKLFTYRYSQGTGIAGMTFGNLFMAALSDIFLSQERAIERTCEILRVKGRIIPVTYERADLLARYSNGAAVLGEHRIDEPGSWANNHAITELSTIPAVRANKKALRAISEADLVVLGPGDLFTSIISTLVVGEVTESLKAARAKIAYIVNLMTKYGQTDEFGAQDHVDEIEKYVGRKLDFVLVNKPDYYSKRLLARYGQEKATPVEDDLADGDRRIIRQAFVSSGVYQKHKADRLKRSLIRHDSVKLAKAIVRLL